MKLCVLTPLAALVFVSGVEAAPPSASAGSGGPAAIPAASPADLQAALKAGGAVIVEFGGEHCIPCMKMQPVLREVQALLGKRGRVVNFWIQPYPDVARQHRIMVMPTQVIFDAKGREIFRHMGFFPRAEFEKVLRGKGLL